MLDLKMKKKWFDIKGFSGLIKCKLTPCRANEGILREKDDRYNSVLKNFKNNLFK